MVDMKVASSRASVTRALVEGSAYWEEKRAARQQGRVVLVSTVVRVVLVSTARQHGKANRTEKWYRVTALVKANTGSKQAHFTTV